MDKAEVLLRAIEDSMEYLDEIEVGYEWMFIAHHLAARMARCHDAGLYYKRLAEHYRSAYESNRDGAGVNGVARVEAEKYRGE